MNSMLDLVIYNGANFKTLPIKKATRERLSPLLKDADFVVVEDSHCYTYAILGIKDRVEIVSNELMFKGKYSITLKKKNGNCVHCDSYFEGTPVLVTNLRKIKKIIRIIREESLLKEYTWTIGPRLRRYLNTHVKSLNGSEF